MKFKAGDKIIFNEKIGSVYIGDSFFIQDYISEPRLLYRIHSIYKIDDVLMHGKNNIFLDVSITDKTASLIDIQQEFDFEV